MFGFKISIKRKIQYVAAWLTNFSFRPKISLGNISLEPDEKSAISEIVKCNQFDAVQPCNEKSETMNVSNIDTCQQSSDKLLILHED